MKTLEYWHQPRNGFSHDDAREIKRLFREEASANLEALAYSIAGFLGHKEPAPLHIVLACEIAQDGERAQRFIEEIKDLF